MDILLDTNAILAVFNYKIDIFREIPRRFGKVRFYTVKAVVNELKAIANDPNRSRKERDFAKYALQLLEINKVEVLDIANKKADEILVDLSKNFVIFTLDKEVKRKIKKKGGYYLELRGGKLFTNFPEELF